jgi:hypothetical protein
MIRDDDMPPADRARMEQVDARLRARAPHEQLVLPGSEAPCACAESDALKGLLLRCRDVLAECRPRMILPRERTALDRLLNDVDASLGLSHSTNASNEPTPDAEADHSTEPDPESPEAARDPR